MRQLFSWRFLAAVAALAGLALLANAVLINDDSLEAVVRPEVVQRRIDLIEPIFAAQPSDGFHVGADGVTHGYLDLILNGERVLRVAPGTFGEVQCDELDQVNRCAVFADLLGEAVIWFSIQPQAPRSTVELGPIVDLQDGYAIFENGWQIRYPPVIERRCGDVDIPSFSDFLKRFGPNSVSIVDLTTHEVVAVRCGEPVTVSTSSEPVATSGGPVATTVPLVAG